MNRSYTTYINSEISVIIPTYYRASDLSELFESILRQTINPVEVIVVDDTPNDTIKIVCEVYKSKYEKINTDIKYLRNPRELGLTVARNVGIENASGGIILFLDSDVILHQEFIEKILEVFKDNSNALGVHGWVGKEKIKYNKIIYLIYELLARIFHLYYHSKNSCKYPEYPCILTKIINCTHMRGCNMAFKKDVFNEFRFDENLTKYCFNEDLLFSHSIFQKYPNSLFITPYAKNIHKYSEAGRMEDKELNKNKRISRKYVLTKLFGFKGLLIYYWQNIGLSIVRICKSFL